MGIVVRYTPGADLLKAVDHAAAALPAGDGQPLGPVRRGGRVQGTVAATWRPGSDGRSRRVTDARIGCSGLGIGSAIAITATIVAAAAGSSQPA